MDSERLHSGERSSIMAHHIRALGSPGDVLGWSDAPEKPEERGPTGTRLVILHGSIDASSLIRMTAVSLISSRRKAMVKSEKPTSQ